MDKWGRPVKLWLQTALLGCAATAVCRKLRVQGVVNLAVLKGIPQWHSAGDWEREGRWWCFNGMPVEAHMSGGSK